jgi:hypothetical protein
MVISKVFWAESPVAKRSRRADNVLMVWQMVP